MRLSSVAIDINCIGNYSSDYYCCFNLNGIYYREFIYFDHNFYRYINFNFKRYYIDWINNENSL